MSGYQGWVERCFLRCVVVVGAVAWLSLVLAELGRLRVGLLLVLLTIGALTVGVIALGLGRPAGPRPASRPRRRSAAALEWGALLLLCAALFFRPYEAVVAGSDASVYVSFGRKIAEAGALVFEDELVRGLPAESRAELFENRDRRFRRAGRLHRFPGGFQILSVTDATVSTGFSPLFPVLTGLFHQVGSVRGSLYVAPVFATLSVCCLFLIAGHLGGRRTAWLSVALTLAALPQVWFARLPVAEMVAQFFVLAAVLAWLVALRDRAPRWAFAAGWLLGLACFAKVDLNVILPVVLTAFAAWRWLVCPRERTAPLGWLLASFLTLVAHNVAHYLAFPSDYTLAVENMIRLSAISELAQRLGTPGLVLAVVGLIVSAGVAAALWRSSAGTRRRVAGVALTILVLTYAYNYGATVEMQLDHTVAWFSWYLSWPLLLAGLAALVWLVAGRAVREPGVAFTVVLLTVVGLQYLWNPLESTEHIWSMRRFVPVVLPLLMLVVSLGVVAAVDRIGSEFRAWTLAASGVLLLALVARPSLAVVGEPFWRGAVAQTAKVAQAIPPGAVVLMSPGLAATHVPTTLAYLHDVDTVLVQDRNPSPFVLERAVRDWRAGGRRVFFAFSGGDSFSFFAPQLTLSDVRHVGVDVLMLERTRDRLPQSTVPYRVALQVYEVSPRLAGSDVDVGDPADDTFFNISGFHGPERGGPVDGSFRWTNGRGQITVPAGSNVTLTLIGWRPTGVSPAEVVVWVGGEQAVGPLTLPNTPEKIRLAVPFASGPVELTVASNVFSPRAVGLSPDPRDLGVQVHRVELGTLIDTTLPTAAPSRFTIPAPLPRNPAR